jgi:hypothetical protein
LDNFTPREESRASLLDPRASLLEPKSPHTVGQGEKEGRKDVVDQFVRVLDAQLLEDNNIPIGDILNVVDNESVPFTEEQEQ